MNKKHTKRALFTSALVLLLCLSMLIGTTFAWFTDSASTGVNKIQSGNLDIGVYYALASDVVDGAIADDKWQPLSTEKPVFNQEALYEPGYTEVVYFKFVNEGNLALKYTLLPSIISEQPGTNKAGAQFMLSNYLYAYQQTGDSVTIYSDREKAQTLDGWATIITDLAPVTLAEAAVLETSNAKALSYETALEPDEVAYTTLVLFMPTTVGNEANHDGEHAPSILLGIDVVATQYTSESDSFGKDYDEDAEYPEPIVYDYIVSDLDGLKEAFAEGGNVLLTDDITLDNMIKIEEGKEVYLDMNGQTIDFERVEAFVPGNPLFYPQTGSKLTITGNGTVDLGDNFDAALVYPAGEVIIENGTFIRNRVPEGTSPDNVQTLFMGVKSVGASVVINGGYFDGGYYDANAELAFSETEADIANRGKSSDKNLYRTAIKNNTSLLLNLSWSSAAGTQDFRIYGGTFVGANPAWGDEGCAMPITPNYLRPWSYYQGCFLDGQELHDDQIVIPEGYTITESETEDGRPVFTVTYSK